MERQPFYGYRIYGWFDCPNPYDPHRYGYFIWPGLWFARLDFTQGRKVDFRPTPRLHGDTGSGNGLTIFKDLDWSQFDLVKEEHCLFENAADIYDGGYSLFDRTWVHCWNASNYMGKPNVGRKMQLIYQMIEEKLINTDITSKQQ